MTAKIAVDQGEINEEYGYITFLALPYPLPKLHQKRLQYTYAAIKAGDIKAETINSIEAGIRKEVGIWHTRQYIPPVPRPKMEVK